MPYKRQRGLLLSDQEPRAQGALRCIVLRILRQLARPAAPMRPSPREGDTTLQAASGSRRAARGLK